MHALLIWYYGRILSVSRNLSNNYFRAYHKSYFPIHCAVLLILSISFSEYLWMYYNLLFLQYETSLFFASDNHIITFIFYDYILHLYVRSLRYFLVLFEYRFDSMTDSHKWFNECYCRKKPLFIINTSFFYFFYKLLITITKNMRPKKDKTEIIFTIKIKKHCLFDSKC